jgi:hypothetical protein
MTMKQNSPHQSTWWWSAPKSTLPGRTPKSEESRRLSATAWLSRRPDVFDQCVSGAHWVKLLHPLYHSSCLETGRGLSKRGAGPMNESTQNAFSPFYITWTVLTERDVCWPAQSFLWLTLSQHRIFLMGWWSVCVSVWMCVVLCVLLGEIGSEISF